MVLVRLDIVVLGCVDAILLRHAALLASLTVTAH
jgi:hypothetical protein